MALHSLLFMVVLFSFLSKCQKLLIHLCSPVVAPSFSFFQIHFPTMEFITEFVTMPLWKTCHLFLASQKFPGDTTTWHKILWHTWQKTTHMKVLWRRHWKTSSAFLDGKIDFKDLRKVYYKSQASTSPILKLSWQLSFITGDLQHWNEGPRQEL